MNQILIVYWSGTGNTAAMAEMVASGIREAGKEPAEKNVSGKTIGLFGSYGWGDGQWMRDWSDRMKQAGAYVLGGEDAICCGAPDASAEEALKELGRQLAES